MPLLTIVFTDVVGSSATKRDVSLGRDSRERDHAYLEKVQTRHFDLVRASCQAHAGKEVSTMGDAFYLTFEDPVEAVRCAVDIQQRLTAGPIETPLGPLQLRIGIHSGFPEFFEGSWHGTDVDTAARVEAAATARQILLSSRTYELIRHMTDVRFHSRGEFALKGVDRMTLWEADWDGKGPRPTAARPLGEIERQRSMRRGAVILAAAVIAGILAIPPVRNFLFRNKSAEATSGIPSLKQGKFVAVLPMRILGDQSALGYVADGLVEELSAKLFQLHDMHTTSASDVQRVLPGSTSLVSPAPPNLNEVARHLGVNLLVSGTIQGSGDKLRIVASLDDVAAGRRVWTREFSGVRQDLLTLEEQIYGGLVEALALRPTSEESARATPHPTEDIEAYDLYLKGRSAMRGQQDVKNIQAAIDYYEQALRKDPGFALAYAGVADASLVMYHEKKDSFWSQKALWAAQQALRLNDNVPEVHFSLGRVYNASGKGAEAISELKRALQLAPNSDDGYRGLGKAYLALGQKDLALKAYQKAIDLNPYYWENYNYAGQAYSNLGEYDKALAAFRRIIELEPDNSFGYLNAGSVYFRQGKYDQCIPFFQKALQIQPHYFAYSNLGTAFFFLKRYAESVPMFEKAVEMNPNDSMLMGNLADAYRWSGQLDKANFTYDRAIALAFKQLQVNPRDANVLDELGLYYAKKGNPTQALDFMRRARAVSPDDVGIVYDQAEVLTIVGRSAEALKTLREALQKGYSLEEAKSDPELTALQATPEFGKLVKEFSKSNKSN